MKRIRWLDLLLELLVVIFGVSIAFSLSTWSENRKAKNVEQQYLASFLSDLQEDILVLCKMIYTLEVQKQNYNHLIRSIYTSDLQNDSLLDEFKQNQVFNYKTPFLCDNIQYWRRNIVNTDIMTSSKYTT